MKVEASELEDIEEKLKIWNSKILNLGTPGEC